MPLRTYDADGEMTDDNGTTLAWTAFGKAATVTQAGGNHLAFTYGPDDARIEKDATVGNQSEQVLYFSGAERLTQGPYTAIRRTVTLADLSVIDTGGAGGHVLYPVTDNLGSTIALGNADGSLAQGMDYGPFGNRTSAGWTGPLGQNQAININTTETDRGYTGQEELDTVDLVDYNARLYDPALGRFLSVDPMIGHPESTQGINPYSYVENAPLNATDPTGEMPVPLCATRYGGQCGSDLTSIAGDNAAMPAQATVTQTSIATGEVVATYSASGASAWTLANTAKLAQQFDKVANAAGSGGGQGAGTTNPNAKNNVPTHDVKNQKPTYADKATYGEIRSYARTKKGGSPKGLGDVKATIGAVCQRNGNCCPGYDNCKEIDGSNSTGTDKQAWKNIMNTRGSDKSKGANYMCVNTQVCGFVHQVYTHRHGKVILEERKNPLKPTVIMTLKHTAGPGGTLTLYFYDDPNKQWLTHKDYIEGWNGGAQ